jgi:hypothetical protein
MAPGEIARVGIRYDEFTIVVTLRYRGRPLFTQAPDALPALPEIDPDTVVAYVRQRLLRGWADRVRTQEQGGEQLIRLQFDH